MSTGPRIGVGCPLPAERAAVADWLRAGGFEPVIVRDESAVASELDGRGFELLIADAAWAVAGAVDRMLRTRGVRRPLVLITDASAPGPRAPLPRDATTVSRPLAQSDLVLAVSLALAEGRPARRSRRVAVPYLPSTMDGVPSQVVDVSNEGLRVELSDRHRGIVPPFFTVRIPAFDIAVLARRVWVGPAATTGAGRLWCGAALGRAPADAWLKLVETAPTAGARSQVVRLR